MIATEWTIVTKFWNFQNKRQNQLIVTSGDELIPNWTKNVFTFSLRVDICNTSTILRLKSLELENFFTWNNSTGQFPYTLKYPVSANSNRYNKNMPLLVSSKKTRTSVRLWGCQNIIYRGYSIWEKSANLKLKVLMLLSTDFFSLSHCFST